MSRRTIDHFRRAASTTVATQIRHIQFDIDEDEDDDDSDVEAVANKHSFPDHGPTDEDVVIASRTELADPVFAFGKYQGLSYMRVKEGHPDYLFWALNQTKPSPSLQHYMHWVHVHCHTTRRILPQGRQQGDDIEAPPSSS